MVETTNSKKIAQTHMNTLRSHAIDCSIKTLNIDNTTLYSVQAGPFSYKKDALVNIDKIKRLGVKNAFITNAAPN